MMTPLMRNLDFKVNVLEATRQDRVVRLESALLQAWNSQRLAAALRKMLKTKLKRELKTLVNDCLHAF